MTPPHLPPAPTRQAWLVLGACFLTFSIGASLMHSYTVFLLAFIAEFGWTRAQTSLAYSVAQFVGGISSPGVGFMVDRLGSRRMVLMGGILLTVGLIGASQANELWQIVLLYGVVMTVGANCVGMLVFVPLVSANFQRHRGLAISILQSANAFGRAVSAPVSQILISGVGWRGAYMIEAAAMAIVVLPLAALFRKPTRIPAAPPKASADAPPQREWTLRAASRTRQFWLLFLVYMLTSVGSFFVSLHQIAFAVDIGFDGLYAASVLGAGAFLALPGVILTGTLSDYIGREKSALIAYAISIVGILCALAIETADQHLLLWLHACLFGLTWGARGPAITTKTADLFAGPRLGTIFGVITMGSGLGAAIGSWGAGFVFDMTGSYRVAFWLAIAAYVGGSAAFWSLRRYK